MTQITKPTNYDECECGNVKECRSKTCVACYHERMRTPDERGRISAERQLRVAEQ